MSGKSKQINTGNEKKLFFFSFFDSEQQRFSFKNNDSDHETDHHEWNQT